MNNYGNYHEESPTKYGDPPLEKGPEWSSPFGGNDLTNHILNVVYRQNAGQNRDPIERILEDKIQIIRSKIELILLQLYQRKSINRKIQYQIDLDGCRLQNLQFEMGEEAYGISPDRLTIERIRFDLERQKRMEEESYFRDTGLLNKDLRDTLIQYLEEKQRNDIFNPEGET